MTLQTAHYYQRHEHMYKKQLEEYEQKGITVIESVFTDDEMERLKQEAHTITEADVATAGYPHTPIEYKYGKKALVFFPAITNDYINQIRKDPRMVKIVKAFLGDNVKQVNNQIYFREAHTEDQFNWHRDIIFRTPTNRFPNIREHYMQTIIAVDDLAEDNGTVEFVPGSHLEPDDEFTGSLTTLRTFDRRGLYGTKYVAPKGSVLLWRVDTVHGSEPNQSNSDRMTYMNGLARAEGCLDYPWYMKDGEVQDIDPTLIP